MGTRSRVRRSALGESNSPSIPATVVDECVYHRSQLSHKVSLFEIGAKYADVVTLDVIEKELVARIPKTRSAAA